ncbi:hypothetical protein [Bradyrhizobium pachyrhizi]|uniref:hypothetical protein n=1 Tax=Bradyrhizobium pachyrhizi TaxID=280333 RepID=UPI003D366F91
MNVPTQRGYTFRPDPSSLRERSLTSLVRAAIISVHRHRQRGFKAYEHDRDVERVLRAAVEPTDTSDVDGGLGEIAFSYVAALTAVSAGAAVLARALQVKFGRAASVSVLSVAMPSAAWLGEGKPIPVQQGQSSLVPVTRNKIGAISVLTNEMMAGPNIEALMRAAMIEATAPVLDASLFSTDAGTPELEPDGILNGVAALPASSGTGYDAMVADVGSLAEALAGASGAGAPLLIASPRQYTALGFAPRVPYPVLQSAALVPGTIIGLVPEGIAASVSTPRFETSDQAVLHTADPASNISDIGAGVMASPVLSMTQTDSTALRIILPVTWARRNASAVAWLQGVNW